MSIVISYIVYSVAAFLGLYVYYIALMMSHKWLKGTQWHIIVRIMLYPFMVADWLVNVLVLSVWFWEVPGYTFEVVTKRLQRWRRKYEGQNYLQLYSIERRRLIFAEYTCDKFLDYFDTIHNGDHC